MTMKMAERGATERVAYAPITRVDVARREVEVTATSEALDAYGTIFDYAASREAFGRWLGNVREMHDNVAVGRRVAVICDDAERQIRVRLCISRGAESTWQKILDGTLCGASIGATNVVWHEACRPDAANKDATVRVATSYELVELSLVDNPANPDCIGIAVVRGMEPDEGILDEVEEGEAGRGRDTEDTEILHGGPRKGDGTRNDAEYARDDAEWVGKDLEMRDAGGVGYGQAGEDGGVGYGQAAGDGEPVATVIGDEPPLHAGMRAMAQMCGCAVCGGIVGMLGQGQSAGEPRSRQEAGQPGGVEAGQPQGIAPTDAMARGKAGGDGMMRGEGVAGDEVRGVMVAARQAASGVAQLRGLVERMAHEQGSAFGELRTRLARIEAQPMPGGPALRAAEKVLGAPMGNAATNVAERIAALQEFAAGQRDQRSQVDVAAEILRLQRGFGE